MRVKIHVTRKLIKKATHATHGSCPVALAVKAVVKPNLIVETDGMWIDVDYRCLPVAKRVAAFIDRFDQQRPVKPFSFVLNLPREVLRKKAA